MFKVVLVLASFGKSLGVRRLYVRTLVRIFEVGKPGGPRVFSERSSFWDFCKLYLELAKIYARARQGVSPFHSVSIHVVILVLRSFL